MSETPDSEYTKVSVPDEDLPDDLQPDGENPLAEPSGDDDERQDLGDPHIEGLERDDDDNLTLPEADADAGDEAHHGNPDSDD